MKDYDFINRVEEIVEKRRMANPLQQEYSQLINQIYPIKAIENVYMLGYCYMLTTLKKDFYKYFCEDDKKIIDEIIKSVRKSKDMDEILNKLSI